MAKHRHSLQKKLFITVSVVVILTVSATVFITPKKTKHPFSTTHTGQLATSVCDPSNGSFSANITNPYFPLPRGSEKVLEDESEKVQRTVFDQTEVIAGVTTRVVEERERKDGKLVEVSRNFFAQAPDGTVCYFGEEVDLYEHGKITGHKGAWKAGVGQNKPGIIMPGTPLPGQKYQQEIAPGVASDSAEHMRIEPVFTMKAGTFTNVLVVKETPPSTKRYAPGVGMIYDDGLELVKK